MDYDGHSFHIRPCWAANNIRRHYDETHTNDAVSWVMLSREGDIVKLPHEKIIHKQTSRISLELSRPNSLADAPAFDVKSDSGTVYITTGRVIYLPATPTPEFKSFSAPILNFEDTHIGSGWFSASYWTGLVRPVTGGNVPQGLPRLEIKLTFKDGGWSDFREAYQTIRDRLQHAQDIRAETGQVIAVDEDLPQYEESPSNPPASSTQPSGLAAPSQPSRTSSTQPQPDEPPPGYEEAQAQALGNRMEEAGRDQAERH
ncbi:hypothetical protein PspLS_04516 [Pyricularia sp. CBS 133598]|nr:hypothetical protein PspLS_04516 [Pyricularia sp. CBS 133598]